MAEYNESGSIDTSIMVKSMMGIMMVVIMGSILTSLVSAESEDGGDGGTTPAETYPCPWNDGFIFDTIPQLYAHMSEYHGDALFHIEWQ